MYVNEPLGSLSLDWYAGNSKEETMFLKLT